MHSQLKQIFEQTIELFKSDPRVLAGLNFGSAGKEHEDELSDVDPVFIVRDEDYGEFDAELPAIFSRFRLPILLWWPESCNSDDFRNYAIFLRGDEVLQYDINIMKASLLDKDVGQWTLAQCEPEHILFDKTGLLSAAFQRRVIPKYSPDRLGWSIEQYWIYAFIHVKYLKRSSGFKLAYAQDMLFRSHLEVLRALYPQVFWSWWPDVAQKLLRPEHQDALMLYFGSKDAVAVGEALPLQMDCFARDAKAACLAHGLSYPEEFEAAVRSHFHRHFCPTDDK